MSFTISHIALREIRLPLKEPFQISSGVTSVRRVMLLELTDGHGTTVWSECVASSDPNYFPDTIDTSWIAVRDWVAPRLIGFPFQEPCDVHAALQPDFRGHVMAKAAVEMGAWALAAVHRGVSLATLLGGTRDRIGTGISLGIQPSPNTLARKARAALTAGYQKIKLKIKPGADLEYVATVRTELGPDAPLMVDANNAYTVADFEHLAKLDEFGLLMIEQPLAWDDLVRHADLQRHLKTPICLDESITNLDRAQDMVTLHSGKIVNIKPGRVGGFTEAKAIHDFCSAHEIPVWCGGMLETGIGRAYNVALASLPNFTLPGDVSPSARYWERDVVTPEWTMDADGMVDVPKNEPGLGVTVDVDRIDDLTVRYEAVEGGRGR